MFMHADVLFSGLTYQLVTTSHFESNIFFSIVDRVVYKL